MSLLEIEIKAYCDDPAEVERRLAALGAQYLKERIERDLYFSHPTRNFRETDEALRLRLAEGTSFCTYKGPKIGTAAKTREEFEIKVGDFETAREILLRLGFIEAGRVEKRRRIFSLGPIEICIDRVDGLGDFVELETHGSERERLEKELFDLASRLGLERFERRSYLELVVRGD